MAEIGSPAPDPRPEPGDNPWREPARGGYPNPSLIGLSGIDQLRAMLEGRVPHPPLSALTGQRLMEVAPGMTVFEMPLTRWLCSPQGPVSIGPLAIPADAALATAIQTELPPASPFSTSELSLRLLATARPGGRITARGRVIQRRRTIALSEVHLTDQEGRLVGHGTTLCFVQPPPEAIPPPPPPVPPRRIEADPPTPDPFERPAIGTVLPPEIFERHSGLEVLRAQIAGDLPAPPIHYLLGLAPVMAADGEATFVLPVTEWLCAPPPGRAQGGFIALLAEAAMMGAIQTKLPAGTAFAPIDLKVNYLRPLAADGREARASGRVLHAGRRIAVASSEVRDADGKPVAIATGSAMALPGRAASLGSPRAEGAVNRRSAALMGAAWLALTAIGLLGCGSTDSHRFPVQRTPSPLSRLAGRGPIHIAVIVMENAEYGDIIGSPATPYINGLARRYGLATESFAIRHPSLPNYLALTSGSTQGITDDCTDCRAGGRGLADQLQAAAISWRAYMEGLPHPCFTGSSAGEYAKKHDPFVYFNSVSQDASACAHVVPLDRLATDERTAAMPDFAWITPNLCHDMHDCSTGTGDRFLARTVPALLSALGPRGLLFLTVDEGSSDSGCCRLASGGHVATIVAAAGARPRSRLPTPVDHYSILQTIEDLLGLDRLAGAACACTPSLQPLIRR